MARISSTYGAPICLETQTTTIDMIATFCIEGDTDYRGVAEVTAELLSITVGDHILTRSDLVAMFGEQAVRDHEEAVALEYLEAFSAGDFGEAA